jgi:hypothetical protein
MKEFIHKPKTEKPDWGLLVMCILVSLGIGFGIGRLTAPTHSETSKISPIMPNSQQVSPPSYPSTEWITRYKQILQEMDNIYRQMMNLQSSLDSLWTTWLQYLNAGDFASASAISQQIDQTMAQLHTLQTQYLQKCAELSTLY